MKLEVGMYVRLNCNYELGIGKTIREIDEDNFIKAKFKDDFECSLPTYMITKASHNIIDLIEVGDYVNGSKGIDISIIGKDKEKWAWVEQMEDTDNKYGDDYVGYNNEQIKSIVTKEIFSSVEYRVETN